MFEGSHEWRWVLYALLLWAAWGDVRRFRIPNYIPVVIVLILLISFLSDSAPLTNYLAALGSGAIGLAVGLALFHLRMMGAGDGKLFAAVATWFALDSLLRLGFFISVAGVIISLASLGLQLNRRVATPGPSARLQSVLKSRVPYAVAIALGSIAAGEFPMVVG